MKILGISAYYHDSAAALVIDGHIAAAAQEERFTRKKHDPRFPAHAVAYCLEAAQCSADDLDYIAFYDKPLRKFERLVETYLATAPRGFKSFSIAMPVWVREKLFQKRQLISELRPFSRKEIPGRKLLFTEHHQSHAASAFFPSPFEEAAVLTMDGVGEWATSSMAIGRANSLEMIKEIDFPHSLGLLYSAFTHYLGFKVNSGEYKIMGLAPYGEPKYAQTIFDHLIDLKDDGSFRLDIDYFDYCAGLQMTNARFCELFGGPVRTSEKLLDQRHMDLAASIQKVTEEVVLRMGRSIFAETGHKNICLAGGVALNCVANGRLLQDGCFEKIWIQPAAGDAGGALGAALSAYHEHAGKNRHVNGHDAMQGAYLGPSFRDEEIQRDLKAEDARFERLDDKQLIVAVAAELANGAAVGWFQGRMEYGPRALGNRSILGDPRSPTMQKLLNLKIKYRESFRPFAPSCLYEDVADWFDLDEASPYMLLVAGIKKSRRIAMAEKERALFGIEKLNIARSDIPAVTHVDYSARVQTVHEETNPRFYSLLREFKRVTNCPVLINTSFNVRGEPIVATPREAFQCFMGSDLDMLAIGNYLLRKKDQVAQSRKDYKNSFDPD